MSEFDDEIPQPWPQRPQPWPQPQQPPPPQVPPPQQQQQQPRYVPPPRPARKPTNPWMIIGWIILIIIVFGIYEGIKNSNSNSGNSPEACPSGYYYNTVYQQCEVG
jgi:hypothetical protein